MALESGIRGQRLEFVREDTIGEPPTDPSYLLFSDTVQSVSPSFSPAIAQRFTVGDPDVQDFFVGTESHEYEITYDLNQWFTDASGNAQDASYDGLVRGTNGELPNTHTIVQRDILGGSGVAGGGSRLYTVITGAKIGTVTISGEPESGEPITVTLSYQAEKIRPYKIDQPDSGTTLDVVSTSDNDTMTLTIEDDDAGTSEEVTLTGTTTATTTATFSSIDAARLSTEAEGDITISDGSGNTLMTIYGSGSYQDREGDLGVPLLGSGSHASAIGGDFEQFLGDEFERPAGTALFDAVDIASAELTVENNLETQPSHQLIGQRINEGARNISLGATIFGEKASFDSINEHLRVVSNNIKWVLSDGELQVDGAILDELGSVAREAQQAVMTIDNTFTGTGLQISDQDGTV